jgi:uncharacterized coiled-coil protein SlyX
MSLVPPRKDGESELSHLRRKELAFGLWQGDELERMGQQDQTISTLQARVIELERTLRTAKDHAQALARAVINGMAELTPDELARDVSGHINLMGGLGDPDYMRGTLSCRHVDLRQTTPRKPARKKEAA